ncbi:uncharacterized protein LOC120353092 isoform X3 [Nilaparvata lugens]|uniref:uncharacterized protein LOC120353092 isoform X3 n=1 Tax=Nilaparvata lugens TaxID=108931 RepID=UPI00193CDC2F|nr:uncharacterized protein LOC120353092 isoform X3 [Nilaparvata lugens]
MRWAVGGPGCSSTWSATSLDSWCPARGGTAGPSMPWMTSSAWQVMSSGSSRRSAGCVATPVLTFSDEGPVNGGSGCMVIG